MCLENKSELEKRRIMDSKLQWLMGLMLVASAIVVSLWQRRSKPKNQVQWPPGPSKLPVIGNLHQLYNGGELLHVTLTKMSQQYGRIMTIWLGGWRPTIVVSDHELAWEVLVTKSLDYASRKLPYMSRFITADWKTLATSNNGPFWDLLRKGLQNTALSPLHISSQANFQQRDIEDMIERLKIEASENGHVVRPHRLLRLATVRFIARMCFGVEFDDESFVEGMDHAVEEAIRLSGHVRMVDVFALSRFIPGLTLPFKQTYQVQRLIEGLVRPYYRRVVGRTTLKPNTYLDFLISQDLHEDTIIYCIFEVFLLAVDSTSNTIAWTLAFLMGHQEIQQKLHDEITSHSKGRVGVEEVSKMQYLHAIIKESMRMRPIAPLAIPHMANKECYLLGTKIPKGTAVMVNLYSVLYDPKVWHEPHQFMPERFLSSHGKDGGDVGFACMNTMERSFLPFGAGRRICAGAEVAKLHVALTVANLVSAYKWSTIDGQPLDMREDLTFVLMMKTPIAAHLETRQL